MKENSTPLSSPLWGERGGLSVSSETGRLRAVLLHRPGVEIERMTPMNCAHALYSDILDRMNVDIEYGRFCGVLEKWAKVYYVEDILRELLKDEDIKTHLVNESVFNYGHRPIKLSGNTNDRLAEELMGMDAKKLARILIEGYENPQWEGVNDNRYLLEPLYNLLFTRDASSTIYNRVLINSMSFEVRERESLIYEAIFRHYFGVETLSAATWNPKARTEGGDIHIASPDLLVVGEGVSSIWHRPSPANANISTFLCRSCHASRSHSSISTWSLRSLASTSAWPSNRCCASRGSSQARTQRSSASTTGRSATDR